MITLKLPKDIKHIIFDFDGTLVDSAPGIISCLSHVLNNNNITPKCKLDSNLIGPPLVDMIKSVSSIEDADQVEKLANEFKICYDSKGYKDTIVFPYVYDMLTTLLKKNLSLYIATNKRDKPTRLIVDYLSWKEVFTKIYSVDMNNQLFLSKSEMIKSILKDERLESDDVVYIGDTDDDKKAAKNAGVSFHSAYWGY